MKIMSEVSEQAAIVAVVESLPLGTFMLVLFLLMSFIYSATTVDSSAYTIASVASKNLAAGEREPRRWNRLFWALALGATAVSLMYLGGLEPLKTVSIVVRVPAHVRHRDQRGVAAQVAEGRSGGLIIENTSRSQCR